MLDPKKFAQNFDAVVERLATRGGNLDFGAFRTLMAEREDSTSRSSRCRQSGTLPTRR